MKAYRSRKGGALTGPEVATSRWADGAPLVSHSIERLAASIARTSVPGFAAGCLFLWLSCALGAVATMSGAADLNLNPDAERNLFALVSALALAVTSILFSLALLTRRIAPSAIAVVALLAFMSFDEAFEVHEWLERSLGADWTTLYAPLVALGTVVSLHLVWALRASRAAGVFLLGGACWSVAYLLEKIQWDGNNNQHRFYDQMMFTEEMLELGGSLLLSLAALLILRSKVTFVVPDTRPDAP